MKQSRDSTLYVGMPGRRLVEWDGESRIANAGPLMDHFALAEGCLAERDNHVAAGGGETAPRVRTVLITTRTEQSGQDPNCGRPWRSRRADITAT